MIMSGADFRPHVLNETASIIWQAADGVTPLHEIANNVCEEFDVAPDVAFDDATTLVRDMVSHGVLLLSDQPAVITAKPQAEKPNGHADAGQPRHMKPFYWGIEEELLLCCARASMDPERAERMLNLLRGKIEWDILIAAAERHGLRPLLCWHLHSVVPELVPEDVLVELRRYFYANAAQNLQLTAELLNILALFESRDIPAIPFKGPISAISIYGNLALREFGDLDILIREESMHTAAEVLSSLGYRPEFRVPRSQLRGHLRKECEGAYIHENENRIDLHWRIAPSRFRFTLDIEGVWLRHQYVRLGETEVRNLSPEDTLSVLCAHGGRHLWDKLELISGVAEFTRVHQNIDWDQVVGRALEANSRRTLFLGLLLAHKVLDADLPEEILAGIEEDSAVRKLATEILIRLFKRDPNSMTPFEQCRYYSRLADRRRDRVMAFPRTALNPTAADLDLVQLPRFLSPLYYLLRAFRLMTKCASPEKE